VVAQWRILHIFGRFRELLPGCNAPLWTAADRRLERRLAAAEEARPAAPFLGSAVGAKEVHQVPGEEQKRCRFSGTGAL
jgi:hypothetical protein